MDWWIGPDYNIIIYAQFLSGEPVSWAVAHLLQLSIPVNCSALPGWPLYQPILAQSRPPPDSLPLSLSHIPSTTYVRTLTHTAVLNIHTVLPTPHSSVPSPPPITHTRPHHCLPGVSKSPDQRWHHSVILGWLSPTCFSCLPIDLEWVTYICLLTVAPNCSSMDVYCLPFRLSFWFSSLVLWSSASF